jgi:hypothetical protein
MSCSCVDASSRGLAPLASVTSPKSRRACVFGFIISLHAHLLTSTIDHYSRNNYCKYILQSLILTVKWFLHNIDYAFLTMSDATLPTLRSTSSGANPRSTSSSIPSSSESDVYPFLVLSQHSIINGEPPEVDNGKLARQKRKRTR